MSETEDDSRKIDETIRKSVLSEKAHGVYTIKLSTRNKLLEGSLMEYLTTFLLNYRKICPNCGGIVPNLRIKHQGFTFDFVCIKISYGKQVLDETDYEKLGEYCKAETLRRKKG